MINRGIATAREAIGRGLGRGKADDGGVDYSSLLTGLVSWFTMEEASGTRFDSHGSNDLTETGSVTAGTGKKGNAAQYPASVNNYLGASNVFDSGGSSYTWATWVYSGTLDTSGTGNWIINKRFNTAGSFVYQIAFRGSGSGGPATPDIRCNVWNNSDTAYTVTGPAPPSNNTWYFIVMRVDNSAKEVGLYVDGTWYGPTSFTGTPKSSLVRPFRMGQAAWTSSFHLTNGRLDESAFWSRALTDAEADLLYNSGAGITYSDL